MHRRAASRVERRLQDPGFSLMLSRERRGRIPAGPPLASPAWSPPWDELHPLVQPVSGSRAAAAGVFGMPSLSPCNMKKDRETRRGSDRIVPDGHDLGR